MDNVDKTLLLSLRQDLDILNRTVQSIPQAEPDGDDITSWLFPSKPYRFVDALIADQDFSNASYINYLELIIDRVYAVARLLVIHIKSKTTLKENKHVIRPKQITFGFSINLLWRSVSALTDASLSTDTMTTTIPGDGKRDTTHRGCQTDIMTLTKCDSCASAVACMKNLMQCFQSNDDADIAKEREQLKCNIFDITQFGSMMRSTVAIEKSLNLLFGKLQDKSRANDLLRLENGGLKSKIEQGLSTVSVLEREVHVFKEKVKNDEIRFMMLSSQRDELILTNSKCEKKIKMLEEVESNINSAIRRYRKNTQGLVMNNTRLNKNLHGLCNKQLNILQVHTKVVAKMVQIETVHEHFSRNVAEVEKVINKVDGAAETISKNCEKLQVKIEKMCRNLQGDSDNFQAKFREFHEKIMNYAVNVQADISKKNETSAPCKVQGNPVADISKQIEENKKQIQSLEMENCKLNKLLVKFSRLMK